MTPCWLWKASRTPKGYGRARGAGRTLRAHRLVYELLIGPVPAGLTLDHLCCNPGCVNPNHLEPVTVRENVLRGTGLAAANARKTVCPKGHPLVRGAQQRVCRPCRAEAARRKRARKETA